MRMVSTLGAAHVSELRRYLQQLRECLGRLDLHQTMGPGGPTAGQLAFHAAEGADFWLRHLILGAPRPRQRDLEFSEQQALEGIQESLRRALEACDLVAAGGPRADQPVDVPPSMSPGGIESWTAALALVHITAHTAEHCGHLDALASTAASTPPD
jgi:uncharacterized damage-inducible protein DinB